MSQNFDDDIFRNFDAVGADFGNIGGTTADRPAGQRDEKLDLFYNKLDDYNQSWQDLEGVKYKCHQHGRFNFTKKEKPYEIDPIFTETPDLQYYKIAISRNGGPTALMLKENTMFFGKKDDPKKLKNIIFIYSSSGKLIKTLDLQKILPDFQQKRRWIAFNFTDEEELFIISEDGYIYFLDPKTGDINTSRLNRVGNERFAINPLVDSRFDQTSNQLILRNQACQFFHLKITSQAFEFKEFQSSQKLEENASADESMISDYIMIPAQESGYKKIILLVADPDDGFHRFFLKSDKEGHAAYFTDLESVTNQKNGEPVGKIEKFALSANNKFLALYANQDRGDLYVWKSDLTEQINRLETGMVGAENIIWCGTDVTVLEYDDKIILVGPQNECLTPDLGNPKTQGLKCLTENDGLRIVNSLGSFFLERVQDQVVETFKIASINPAAKLLNAIKSVDYKIPRADEIIRELGKEKEKLVEGIETLLEIAQLEHWDVPIMKHLLRTASFAKKFTDSTDYDKDRYVNVVKHLIVLTKLRHSQVFARAITCNQFEKYKPKRMLQLLYKFTDYSLALVLIDNLNYKQYLPQVYEDWTITMLKNSKLPEFQLKERLRDKFEGLREKIAQEQDIQIVPYKSKINPVNTALMTTGIYQNQNPENIKMGIDFTKLAKIAFQQNRIDVSQFLIGYEQSIVKKIPFLLEINKNDMALKFAMDSGDPNIIDKVFSQIISKKGDYFAIVNQMLEEVNKIEDGMRHLRNFAKKRKDNQLLIKMIQFQSNQNKDQKNQIQLTHFKQINLLKDFTQAKLFINEGYQQPTLKERFERFQESGKFLRDGMKDEFYLKLIGEVEEVNKLQATYFQKNSNIEDGSIMRSSLQEFITKKYCQEKQKSQDQILQELKNMQKSFELPLSVFQGILFKAYCIDAQESSKKNEKDSVKKWEKVQEEIKKEKHVSPIVMGDLCYSLGSQKHAIQAVLLEKKHEMKVKMLIDIEAWQEAVQVVFKNRKDEDFESYVKTIREKGPAFVEDFIKEESRVKK